jgi:exodeoxyribonuclease VII large subunit
MSGGFFEFHAQMNQRRRNAAVAGGPSLASSDGAKPKLEPVTVSQLTSRIDGILKDGIPETLYVRGEISNFKPHQASGHVYFTLKDSSNCIECVMWKSDAARLKFQPRDGLELVATAKVGIYGQRGRYQLYVTSLRPIGQGALELAFQQLRAKLDAEGLFAADRKKPLPAYPAGMVLVTSPQAAACHDMLKVLRRFAWLRVMIYPVPVQGDGAAGRIAAAIAHLNDRGADLGAHVIIVARGGGSLEDLWAFNEEAVARAIAASMIPVITGIGHEVDVSIADLVADHHAHTPTEAAQVVTANWRGAHESVAQWGLRLGRELRSVLQDARHRLLHVERHEAFRRPLDRIRSYRQLLDDRQIAMLRALANRTHAGRQNLQELHSRLDRTVATRLHDRGERLSALHRRLEGAARDRARLASAQVSRVAARLVEFHPRYLLQTRSHRMMSAADRLNRAVAAQLIRRAQSLEGLHRQLEALNPQNVLRRGFTMTFRKKDSALVRSIAQIKPGDRLVTRFADGQAESIAQDPMQLPLFE